MNLLRSSAGRLLLFGFLYFSEGAPIGLIFWAMPTFLREEGLAIEQITGLTATLVLFWALKFVWAPLIDVMRNPRFGFRGWIFSAQLLMGLTLLPLLEIGPLENFGLFSGLLMAHSFFATLQDVAVDALAIRKVEATQRGILNGSMQTGMLMGRSAFGGGALLVGSLWGWPFVFAALIGSIWISMLLLVFVREGEDFAGSTERSRPFFTTLRAAFASRRTRIGIVFALTSAAAFEAVGALAGPFLIDRGVSSETVGWFYGLPVVVAMTAGGIAGGLISDRQSRTRSVGVFLVGFVALILALAAIESAGVFAGTNAPAMTLIVVMYVFVGLFTAASYALFMDLTDPQIGATQFSAYMGATNGCESWAAWAGGRIAGSFGYAPAFASLALVSLMSLPLLRWLKAHTYRK